MNYNSDSANYGFIMYTQVRMTKLPAIVPVLGAIDFAASPNSLAIETLEALQVTLLDAVEAFDRSDRGLLIRLLAVYCGLQLPCRDDPLVDTWGRTGATYESQAG